MKSKLIAGLFSCLTSLPLALSAAPGSVAAGPNDLDRFRHASPVNERNVISKADAEKAAIPAECRSLFAEGESALKSKHYEVAISRFTAALKLRPPQNAALVIIRLRSDAYIGKGELNKALADANEMIRLEARNFRGYQVRGRVYRRKGELDKAIADYNLALSLNPGFAQLYNNRGVAYSAKGQEQRAIRDFNEAIRLAPAAIDGYVNRGASYYALGDCTKAISDYDQAIRLLPTDPDAYFNRGMAYEKMGQVRKAISDYGAAIRLNPEDPAGYDAMAEAWAEVGDFEQAVKYQMQAINMKNVTTASKREMQLHLQRYQEHKPWREKARAAKGRN